MSEVKAGQASGEHVRQGLIGVESSVREGVVLFLLTVQSIRTCTVGLMWMNGVDVWM